MEVLSMVGPDRDSRVQFQVKLSWVLSIESDTGRLQWRLGFRPPVCATHRVPVRCRHAAVCACCKPRSPAPQSQVRALQGCILSKFSNYQTLDSDTTIVVSPQMHHNLVHKSKSQSAIESVKNNQPTNESPTTNQPHNHTTPTNTHTQVELWVSLDGTRTLPNSKHHRFTRTDTHTNLTCRNEEQAEVSCVMI